MENWLSHAELFSAVVTHHNPRGEEYIAFNEAEFSAEIHLNSLFALLRESSMVSNAFSKGVKKPAQVVAAVLWQKKKDLDTKQYAETIVEMIVKATLHQHRSSCNVDTSLLISLQCY